MFRLKKISLFAALAIMPSVTFGAMNGLYVGGNVGWSDFSQDNDFTDGHNNNNLGAGLFTGYQFAPWFSLEGGVNYLGKAKGANDSTMTVQGAQLSGKLGYTDADWQVYTRLGGMWYRSDVKMNSEGDNISGSDVSPLAAVGMEYSINPQWTTRIEYQWVADIQNSAAMDANVDNSYLSLGISYHFGQLHTLVIQPHPANPPIPATSRNVSATTSTHASSLTLQYAFNQYQLSEKNQQILEKYLQDLEKNGGLAAIDLVVEGYSSTEGSQNNNMKIACYRVEEVRDYLLRQGVAPERIVAEPKGATNQFGSADNSGGPDNTALNRRVEIHTLFTH